MPTVLVVDDEPTIRTLIRAVLEPTEYSVVEAVDGVSALEVAGKLRPDLILLDVALPRLSGLEVCRRLKGDSAMASTPVILLTGFVQQAEREAGKQAGAEGFIAKPFSPAALLKRIDEAVRRQPAATAP
jgi:CheY-like chemotaxis protein